MIHFFALDLNLYDTIKAGTDDDDSFLVLPVRTNSSGAHDILCSQGPSPMLMESFTGVISQLFQQRIVRVGGAVDDEMANLIVAELLYLDSVDAKKVILTTAILSRGAGGKRVSINRKWYWRGACSAFSGGR